MKETTGSDTQFRLEIFQGSRWGINIRDEYWCSCCGVTLPVRHKPNNLRQLLWGGWTCHECGTELDKWCQPVSESEN